jgi:hypothetical protein
MWYVVVCVFGLVVGLGLLVGGWEEREYERICRGKVWVDGGRREGRIVFVFLYDV